MTALGQRGITRLLVEPGAKLAAALMQADFVDELIWFSARIIIGGDGRSSIDDLGLTELADARRFQIVESLRLGEDIMTSYRRAARD
jgi:diaminohydroxyphosphoribosylaminopyrimidine deaminase/5-amino-6-(5-phosphoribosylamino)uracil reductase